jgi:hypothetical protein
MQRVRLASVIAPLLCLLAACADPPPSGGGSEPFRDKWRVVHEGPFQVLDDSMQPNITGLTIGNALGYNDNFVNRGDVIVEFNGDADRIKIEFRKFTFADGTDGAADDFDKLSLWAYNASQGTPKKPADMDEEARCGGEDDNGDPLPWLDDCAIYVYYDGLSQLKRSGADIRVTLPANYREDVAISTADSVEEDTYPNRGNICVSNLNASVQAELQSGLAFVTLAPDTTPSPKCQVISPENYMDCVNYVNPDTMASEPWSQSCGCIAQGIPFGTVKIDSLKPSSSNITVDVVNPDLWTAFRAENAGMNSLSGKNCPSSIQGLNMLEYTVMDANAPWRLVGESNHPSDAAPAGAGFSLQLTSNGCEPVAAVESPADWDVEVTDPPSDIRGNVEVCAGCLAGKSCDDLLPG